MAAVEGVDFLKFRVSGISDIFIDTATESTPGLLSAADKTKLDNLIPSGTTTQHGVVNFNFDAFLSFDFNTPVPAHSVAGATISVSVTWPANTSPTGLPGIITVNAIQLLDFNGNLIGLTLVPSTSDVFFCGWSVMYEI